MSLKSLPPDQQAKEYKRLKEIRKEYKPINYAAVYGAMPKRVSRETGMTVKRAGELLDAYWDRNWSVKKVAEEQYVKEIGGYTWLKNPVSGFWYQLRSDKDRFSTLNQGTGVYIFDSWLARAKARGYMGRAQFHDETLGVANITDESQTREVMQQAIERLNTDLKLNVDFAIDTEVGKSYAEVH